MDSFKNCMEKIAYYKGRHTAFSDFLTFVVCALSMGKKENVYFSVAKKYNAKEMIDFSHSFAALVCEMDNNGLGLVDILGEYFQEFFYNEKLGQFFTPPSVCDLVSNIINPTDGNIADPCCGSGRFFLSSAKKNRNVLFYGADISEDCCKMTLINMCLNGLQGHVSWMNTLTLETFKEWGVRIHSLTRCPYIFEIEEKQNIINEDSVIEELNVLSEPLINQDIKQEKKIQFKRFSTLK